MRLTASIALRSLPMETTSIYEDSALRGMRKSMQSSKPWDGNESSNIRIILISSVSSSLREISATEVEKPSLPALSFEYAMEHFAQTDSLTLSKPSFCSVFNMSVKKFSISIPTLHKMQIY